MDSPPSAGKSTRPASLPAKCARSETAGHVRAIAEDAAATLRSRQPRGHGSVRTPVEAVGRLRGSVQNLRRLRPVSSPIKAMVTASSTVQGGLFDWPGSRRRAPAAQRKHRGRIPEYGTGMHYTGRFDQQDGAPHIVRRPLVWFPVQISIRPENLPELDRSDRFLRGGQAHGPMLAIGGIHPHIRQRGVRIQGIGGTIDLHFPRLNCGGRDRGRFGAAGRCGLSGDRGDSLAGGGLSRGRRSPARLEVRENSPHRTKHDSSNRRSQYQCLHVALPFRARKNRCIILHARRVLPNTIRFPHQMDQSRLEDSPSEFPRCIHRGDLRGVMACNLCGSRGQEFELWGCDIHAVCSDHKKHRGIRSCAACADWKPQA